MTAPSRLERFEQRTEWPLAAIAVLFLVLYSIRVLAEPAGGWFFRHIVDFLIVALPFLRPLRLLSLAVVFNALQRAVGHSIRGKVIVYTVCGAILLVYAASLAVYDLEHHHPEAKIKTFADALWWSMTTVTTVGYGDLWPVTGLGRLVAVMLMIGGISLVGLVTATLASWIVQRVSEEDDANQAATAAHIEELRAEIRRLAGNEPPYGEGDGRVKGGG